MLNNIIKITIRNFIKHKSYTAINLIGLTVGMTAVIFIILWVQDERSYDKFHNKSERIYRITQQFNQNNRILHQTQTPGILKPTLIEVSPEIESATSILATQETLIEVNNKVLNESNLALADESFFKIFSFKLLEGNPNSVLTAPKTVAISESAAKKYFGTKDPMGKIMNIFQIDHKVTGIYKDMPSNSHFHFDVLFSLSTYPSFLDANWGANSFKTYVLLKEGAFPSEVKKQLDIIIKNNLYDSHEIYQKNLDRGDMTTMPLQKLEDIHLESKLLWEFEQNGNGNYVKYLSFIALFILIIALINYINLSTAKSASRAREVGIRKTFGSSKLALVFQFILESVSTSFISLILTFFLVGLLLPFFKELVGKPWLTLSTFYTPLYLFIAVTFVLMSGFLAGIYPALILSSFKPKEVLSGKISSGSRNYILRNILVIFQFTMSIILLIGSFVVYQQMNLSQTKNLGFNREQVVVFKTYGEALEKIDILKSELKDDSSIKNVSISSSLPGKSFTNIGIKMVGSDNGFATNLIAVDYDYLDLLEMEMVEGRFFSRAIESDDEGILINESKAKKLGIKKINGQKIKFNGTGKEYNILGIVKDYNYESLHKKIEPLIIVLTPGKSNYVDSYLSIKIDTDNLSSTLSHIEKILGKINPDIPFEFTFLDDIYDKLYKNEEKTSKIFTIFTLFALIIACLGLIGLTSFVIEQKKKEIGIRKVLGATVSGLTFKLSAEFSRLVIISNVIAWPLAYLLMNNWLEDFAYRVDLEIWMFIIAGIMVLVISSLTISVQSITAALRNPVESLKCE